MQSNTEQGCLLRSQQHNFCVGAEKGPDNSSSLSRPYSFPVLKQPRCFAGCSFIQLTAECLYLQNIWMFSCCMVLGRKGAFPCSGSLCFGFGLAREQHKLSNSLEIPPVCDFFLSRHSDLVPSCLKDFAFS